MTDNRDPQFNLRLPPELREQAERRAREDDRTLTSYIIQLIKRDIARVHSSRKTLSPTNELLPVGDESYDLGSSLNRKLKL